MSEYCQIEQKSADDYARESEERRLEHERKLNEIADKQRVESAEIEAKNHTDAVDRLNVQHDEFRQSIKPRV